MYVNDTVFAHMSSLTESRSQAEEHCPSLRDHDAYFPLILACYGLYPQTTNYALDEWAISGDGQNWYHSLMDTFSTTKVPALCFLTLAILLCVPPYQRMSSNPGAHQPSPDPLLDLGAFAEGQEPNNRRDILEKTAFSAIRVLTHEKIQDRFSEPQQREHRYLSELLTHALGKNPTLVGCREGTLDCYWEAKVADPKDHTEALTVSLAGLAAARHLPQGKITQKILYEDRSDSKAVISCSRMTSSTTLNESISDSKAKKVHFHPDLMIKSDNGWNTLNGRPAALDYVFNILFLGGAGVGKSKIIDRVSRASPCLNLR
jgi:hypothetical protein